MMLERIQRAAIRIGTRIRNPFVVDEHFVPSLGLELAPYIARGNTGAVHHLIRYRWALEVLKEETPETLLDVACGAGYGSFLLAEAFPAAKVLGVDYDRAAVKRARQEYVLPNLAFQHGEVLRWHNSIGEQSFDVIVSFDTLEHVPHREIMMENLVEHLSENGKLLLSTPCGEENVNLKPRWPSHRIEYNAASLFDFMSRYFQNIRRPEDPGFPGKTIFDQLDDTPIDYRLRMNPIICSRPIRIPNPYHPTRR